jgi:hypothetical protein
MISIDENFNPCKPTDDIPKRQPDLITATRIWLGKLCEARDDELPEVAYWFAKWAKCLEPFADYSTLPIPNLDP